ncbi:MAG: hypothetical protein F6K42_22410 [Leptolyngbya sp. SIO1D8]|nr:hypothetical protein [Leptolyngbya sp. SIO1D8]
MSWTQTLRHWGLVMILVSSGTIAPRAAADEFPSCTPPENNEYLLLVRGDTVEARDRIQNLLPTTTDVSVCQYLDNIVVRAGGFTSLENANAWAQYLTEVEGAQAFVARPANPGEALPVDNPVAAEPVNPTPTQPDEPPSPISPDSTTPPGITPEAVVGYAPELLGEGYAVLVDYGNNPEIAKELQQALNQPVGLAVYEQRPFLLAVQSTDAQVAAQVLQSLSNNRFGAFIVDSSEVVLISAGVAIP